MITGCALPDQSSPPELVLPCVYRAGERTQAVDGWPGPLQAPGRGAHRDRLHRRDAGGGDRALPVRVRDL